MGSRQGASACLALFSRLPCDDRPLRNFARVLDRNSFVVISCQRILYQIFRWYAGDVPKTLLPTSLSEAAPRVGQLDGKGHWLWSACEPGTGHCRLQLGAAGTRRPHRLLTG